MSFISKGRKYSFPNGHSFQYDRGMKIITNTSRHSMTGKKTFKINGKVFLFNESLVINRS